LHLLRRLISERTGELARQRQQVGHRRIEADHLHITTGLALREPLMVAIENIAIAGHQNGALGTFASSSTPNPLRAELSLSRAQAASRHGLLFMSDAAGVHEIDHSPAMVSANLRHIRARHAKAAGLLVESDPTTTEVVTL
jgi:hypothetical protein